MPDSNWIVITGAPCSGKSTVITYLKDCGFNVNHEVAQGYIDEQQAEGIEKPWEDKEKFQKAILTRQRTVEDALVTQGKSNKTIFFDRGIPDAIAYFSYFGVADDKIPDSVLVTKYKHVFIFDKPKSDVRHGVDGDDPERLVQLIKNEYKRHKCKIHIVPVMPVEQRAAFVLRAAGLKAQVKKLETKNLPSSGALLPLYKSGYYLRKTKPQNYSDTKPRTRSRKAI
tara:strand:- start:75062 stop:75739 length:678 start_codon:yes stop_codon:yes gene_type:complete